MRIAILLDEYLPESTRIHAQMYHDLALEFEARGFKVVVVVPGTTKQKQPIETDIIDGIVVWRFRAAPIRVGSKLKRTFNETLLSFRAVIAILKSGQRAQFDLCLNHAPTIFYGLLARWLRSKGAHSYLVQRDFFPQWAIEQGLIKQNSVFAKYFRFFEALNYKSADVLALQSPANIPVFEKITPYKHPRTEILYNWSNGKLGDVPIQQGLDIVSKAGLLDKVILFYGGNMGPAQDMDNIMRLSKSLLSEKDARVLLVGQGYECQLIERRIVEWSLTNVTLLPSVSQKVYASILQNVHVGLFSLAKSHTAHNFPGKLLGYMAARLPILGSVNVNNDIKTLLHDTKSGLVTENGQDDIFYLNALKMIRDEKLRSAMGRSSKTLLSQVFSVERAADQILNSSK